ncbi:F-box protein CPR1-like [Manihot esculenta]|uniref:Uncharacterized protein n=1 Tax=Manihot esculenta TaxID=3983 RepID=A0ACB7HW08_MANES|nr:F-box protein CPR1-like [Manihot esculenta]KAG8656301.1 hypothetical protein MANES_04G117566v8 [Manihot esculenta]
MKFDYDLFMEILCFLPIETLLRFRCLSKTCCSCIDSSEFINLHLNQSLKTNTNRNLIIHELEPKGSIYAIELDSLESDRCPVELHRLYNPHFDTFMHGHGSDVFGSCNGLLAMYNNEGIVLWNPATRKHKTLPRFWGHCYGDYEMLHGFGYDALNDDYKLIIMSQHYMENNIRVMVYSLKGNSSTRVEDLLGYSIIRTYDKRRSVGVLAGGSLHWVVNRKGDVTDRVILAFGVGDEKFCELPKPQMESENICLYVEEIGGRLAICRQWPYWIYEIWIMKEYGVMESWTKLFNFTSSTACRHNLVYVKALCCLRTKTGDEVLLLHDQNSKNLFFFGLRQGRTEKLATFGLPQHNIYSRISANVCMRSLAPVKFQRKELKRTREEKKEKEQRRQKQISLK